jgi:hypothetical protein
MRNLEILIEFDWVSEHQCSYPLKLVWSQILFELFKIALKRLLINERKLIEDRSSLVIISVVNWGYTGLRHGLVGSSGLACQRKTSRRKRNRVAGASIVSKF